MAEQHPVCTSCKSSVVNTGGAARFSCPRCGKVEIIRCAHCRKVATHYICPQCQFEGPN